MAIASFGSLSPPTSRRIPPDLQESIAPDFHNVNFAIENYVKKDLNFKLDKGRHLTFGRTQPLITNNNDSPFQMNKYVKRISHQVVARWGLPSAH